jgi:hypothetical protein
METSNLVLAFVVVGAAALILGFEWLLAFRGRIQLRLQPQMPNGTSTTGCQSEDLESNEVKTTLFPSRTAPWTSCSAGLEVSGAN